MNNMINKFITWLRGAWRDLSPWTQEAIETRRLEKQITERGDYL